MIADRGSVVLRVEVPDDDSWEREQALRLLDAALSEDDRLTVDRGRSAVPPVGAKGDGLVDTLITSAVSGVVPLTVTIVVDWLRRNKNPCKVVLDVADGVRIEVTDLDTIDGTYAKLKDLGYDVKR